jgi:hypothetical protein
MIVEEQARSLERTKAERNAKVNIRDHTLIEPGSEGNDRY